MTLEEARSLKDGQEIYLLGGWFEVEKGKFDLRFTAEKYGYDTREKEKNPLIYVLTATNFFSQPMDRAFLTFDEAKKANIERAKRFLKEAKEQKEAKWF